MGGTLISFTRFYILIQILIFSHEVTNKFPGSELIYAHVNNICVHNMQLCISEFKGYFLLKVVIVWLFVDSFDFWHHHQLYCKMVIIIVWAETLLGNYISYADVGVVKLNCFDLLFFKTNLTIPLYILFNLMAHIWEFYLGDRGSRKKIALLAWVTFCVTLSAMIMHRPWICARFVHKQVGKRARWDQKSKLVCFQSN